MPKQLKYLFFDTEMSGCEQLVSIGFVVTDSCGEPLDEDYYVIRPHKKIRKSTIAIHGITTEQAKKEGIPLKKGLAKFMNAAKECTVHVGFAPQNDILAFAIAWNHLNMKVPYDRGEWTIVDVARLGTPYMLERGKIMDGQTPSLSSLYDELFDGEKYDEHNALSDAKATAKCFWKLMNDGWFNFASIVPYSKIHHLCVPKMHEKSKEDATGPDAELPSVTESVTETVTVVEEAAVSVKTAEKKPAKQSKAKKKSHTKKKTAKRSKK